MSKQYMLRYVHHEDYSGEHREWIEEIPLPDSLVKQIQRDAKPRRWFKWRLPF